MYYFQGCSPIVRQDIPVDGKKRFILSIHGPPCDILWTCSISCQVSNSIPRLTYVVLQGSTAHLAVERGRRHCGSIVLNRGGGAKRVVGHILAEVGSVPDQQRLWDEFAPKVGQVCSIRLDTTITRIYFGDIVTHMDRRWGHGAILWTVGGGVYCSLADSRLLSCRFTVSRNLSSEELRNETTSLVVSGTWPTRTEVPGILERARRH